MATRRISDPNAIICTLIKQLHSFLLITINLQAGPYQPCNNTSGGSYEIRDGEQGEPARGLRAELNLTPNCFSISVPPCSLAEYNLLLQFLSLLLHATCSGYWTSRSRFGRYHSKLYDSVIGIIGITG